MFFLTARPRSRLQTPEGLARLKAEAAAVAARKAGRRAAKTRGGQEGGDGEEYEGEEAATVSVRVLSLHQQRGV